MVQRSWDSAPQPLILSLTGGGFRGYFTALVLARIEEMLGAQCYKVFDLIAGTSIGGIISIGLAFGIRADLIASMIAELGPQIFPPRRFKRTRGFFGHLYSADPIERALRNVLTERVDNQLLTSLQKVMVITASPGTGKMEVIASWDRERTGKMALKDAALATAAAPTYFPARRVQLGTGTIDLVDGGIAANAPDAVAIHHGIKELAFAEDRIALLSIGTCAAVEGAVPGRYPAQSGSIGALTRLGGHGIINLMMAIQEQRGINEGSARLSQGQYLRVENRQVHSSVNFLN